MKHFPKILLVLPAIMLINATNAQMEKTVQFGGAAMYPSKNIVENAVNSKDHTTLVTAVKAAGLVEILQGPGPFTVFAPTNSAFDKLPEGTLEMLTMPDNKEKLRTILTYHVVPGRLDAAELEKRAKNGNTELTTVAGGKIWIMKKDRKWWVKDEKGGVATIAIPNVYQSNGVIHVIDKVLMP